MFIFASCQKENLFPAHSSQVSNEFIDNQAIPTGANKADSRKSNLKVAIRKVNNSDNTYRLVLKVDSVNLNETAAGLDPKFEPIYGPDATIYAGLYMPDPNNPDVDLAIFTKDEMVFRKQNENGYFVYVSDPFTTTINFEYELVIVDYTIKLQSVGLPIDISSKSEYFILPNGKTIEQAPKFADIKNPKWINGNLVIVVTIEDDPAQLIEELVLNFDPITNPDDPKSLIKFEPLKFEKTHFNQNTGLSRYVLRGSWDDKYEDGKQPVFANIYGFEAGGTATWTAPKIDLNP